MTEPQFPNMKAAIEALTDFNCEMVYGSPSVKTWEKRCQDSLAKSKRRRRIEMERRENSGWTFGVRLLALLLAFLLVLIIIGVATGKV